MRNPRQEAIPVETFLTYCQRVRQVNDDSSIMRLLFPILPGDCSDPATQEITNLIPCPASHEIVPAFLTFYHGEKTSSLASAGKALTALFA
jgi:hypothetical protein